MSRGPASARAALARHWTGRSPRERWMLLGLAATLALYAGWVGAARPMIAARDEALASIAWSEAALARLAAAPETEAAPAMASADQPIAVTLTDTAASFGLTIRRIEPEEGGARLAIEDAGFPEIIGWITALEQEEGLRVVALEMDRRPEPGVVSANLSVRR